MVNQIQQNIDLYLKNLFVQKQIRMSDKSLKYHKYMLKSASYGQIPSVIQNLQKVSPFSLDDEQIKQALQQFNQQHLSLVKLNSQKQVYYPIFKASKQSNGNYIDQLNKKSYQINHLKRTIQNQESIQLDLPEPVIQLLQLLSNKILKYVDKYYRQSFGTQVFMQITQEGTLNVHLAFTAKNVQLNNFYTGQWNSVWVINKQKIQGKLSVKSHIFENGNVQLNETKQISQQFQFTANMEENASKIIKVIEKFECDTQSRLSSAYQQIPTAFFKHLRRIVPLTKTKMIWNVNSLKMIKNLHSKK